MFLYVLFDTYNPLFALKQRINLNIYSPNTSSTGQIVPCNSTLCGQRRRCLSSQNACAYGVAYLSNNTSSSGVLVEDILHLETDNAQQKSVEAPIALGWVWFERNAV